MKLKAKMAFAYRGRRLQPGDTFEASSPAQGRLLQTIGRAAALDAVDEKPGKVQTRQMKAAEEPAKNALDHDADGRKGGSLKGEESTRRKGKRKYERRDMQAEE